MSDVYTNKGKPDPDVLKSHFIHEGRVEEDVAIRIVHQGEVFLEYCCLWSVHCVYILIYMYMHVYTCNVHVHVHVYN